jgi:hypothetical protein
VSFTPAEKSVYTETNIVNALARHTFKGALCVVPNTLWSGYEADVLVVTTKLQVFDVEVKISRTDLRADREKGKWRAYDSGGEWVAGKWVQPEPLTLEWPRNIHRHYYCCAEPIWRDDLLNAIPKNSGVLTIRLWPTSSENMRAGLCHIEVKRRARSNPEAKPLELSQIVDIARLASLRMWNARLELDRQRAVAEGVAA